MGILALPNYFVSAVVDPKDLVQHHLGVRADVPIQVYIKSAILRQQVAQKEYSLIEPLEVGGHSPPPRVAVGFLLDDGRLFDKRGALVSFGIWIVRNSGGEREVGTGVEGRVDVDEVHLAGELGEEGGEDELLVAPDEAVAPFGLAAGAEEVEGALALLGGLVDGLDRLERQGDAQ